MRRPYSVMTLREASLASAFGGLSLDRSTEPTPIVEEKASMSPSKLPKALPTLRPRASHSALSSPSKSPKKKASPLPKFLNRDTNNVLAPAGPTDGFVAFDYEQRLEENLENMSKFMRSVEEEATYSDSLKETINGLKTTNDVLKETITGLKTTNDVLKSRSTCSQDELHDRN